jgi:phosphoribosylglycinamide formyltransferase 1
MKLYIAVFGSGKGSNFKAILESIQAKKINAEIVLVISNNSNAGILEIAHQNNIPALHFNQKQFSSEIEFNNRLLEELEKYKVNFIVLAGYMKRIHSSIILAFKNRILNIHPALIPSFCGTNMYGSRVHSAVLEYGCKITGVTVHIVDEEYDHGTIVLQKCVKVEDEDTPDTLASRVLKVEHELFPEAIKLFADDKLVIDGRRAIKKKNEN